MTKKLNLFEIWVLGLANLGVKATTYPWKESWFIMVNLLALTHTWEHTRIAILRIYLYIYINIATVRLFICLSVCLSHFISKNLHKKTFSLLCDLVAQLDKCALHLKEHKCLRFNPPLFLKVDLDSN